uniref:Uncharacterized protein n=1 Tax=Anguilla anguilla TaxID=7936 RepID=A0A0E9W0Q1_ANGAN
MAWSGFQHCDCNAQVNRDYST